MRKTLLFISFIWLSIFAFAQTPQAFKYQTVARNNSGEILASQNISFRMTVLQGVLPGTIVYAETHAATTNASGLATLEIGRGMPVLGSFAAINWSTTPIFLKTEIDPSGGTAFIEMGTSELLSVPYALYAENTANNDDADANPTNELQTITQNGLSVSLSQGGGTININDNDNNPANELQQISKAGSTVTLSQGGGSFTDAVNDADANPINELQTISETNYQVTLSQGGGAFLGGIKSLNQTEIDAMTPYNGLTLHNSTTNCINYYYLNNWFESCGICTPQPTIPNAGPDQIGIGGNSTTLAANSPVEGNGLWAIVSGEGGIIADATNPNSTFTGLPINKYLLTWTTSNRCKSSSDTVSIVFWSCGLPIVDVRDDKSYSTVHIGTNCWMAQNLNFGIQISNINNQTNNGIIEKYCFDDNEASCDIFGGFYQWDELMNYNSIPGIQGICPADWHVSDEAEWVLLIDYLGGSSVAGGKMKEIGIDHWLSPNIGATNISGFNALGAGYRHIWGSSVEFYSSGHWWTSLASSESEAYDQKLYYDSEEIISSNDDKYFGFSVRCVKD